jgi:small acid-soluble spore protein D (minor alpha/beta-type SASP)
VLFADNNITNIINIKEDSIMANRNNRVLVPQAKAGLDRFKMEAAKEVGVNLKEGYNGDLTSRENGSVGGQMVKRMVEAYEKNL